MSQTEDEIRDADAHIDKLSKRIEALEAALRQIASRDSKTLHPGEAIAIATQALK